MDIVERNNNGGRTVMEEQKMEKNIYKYVINQWLELPSDYSQKRLYDELKNTYGKQVKQSREYILDVLNQVSEKEWRPEARVETNIDTLYYDEEKRDEITKPNAIPYEAVDLVKALLLARTRKSVNKDDELLDRMNENIAIKILEQSRAEIENDYFSLVMLQFNPIQRLLLADYFIELNKRLQAIWDLLYSQQVDYLAAYENDVIKRLDDILADLICDHDTYVKTCKKERKQRVSMVNAQGGTKSLFDLMYDELTFVREQMRSISPDNKNKSILTFSLPVETEENADIINCLESCLQAYNRKNRGECDKAFTETYKKYLLKTIRNDEIVWKTSSSFLEFYYKEREYIAMDLSEDEFRKQIYGELVRFAKDLFEGLVTENHTSYSFSLLKAESACVGFADTRLKNAHEQIRYGLHEPMRLLRIRYMIDYFFQTARTKGSDEKQKEFLFFDLAETVIGEKLCILAEAIERERRVLHKKYLRIPLLRNSDLKTIQKFVEAYNQKCQKVYGTEELQVDRLSRMWKKERYLQKVKTSGYLLELECQMVMLSEIDGVVKQICKEYKLYKKFFRKRK